MGKGNFAGSLSFNEVVNIIENARESAYRAVNKQTDSGHTRQFDRPAFKEKLHKTDLQGGAL